MCTQGRRNYPGLTDHLLEIYARRFPVSAKLNQRARQSLVDGGSHGLRLMKPFPPRIIAANGAWLTDADGHQLLDFWQGHVANLLGHNPEVVGSELADAFSHGFGLQIGLADRLQIECAEILCQQTGAERVRFTTSATSWLI